MMIFKSVNGNLVENKEKPFKLEKDLQNLVENNIKELLGLKFLATEFSIESYRFDSVAFNEENNSFIIIEYKRGKNESLVDQGYAYLYTLLNRKADFVLLYNEKMKKSMGIKDFSWDQTRIYFISPNFTDYQKNATAFINMPFELYEIKQYQDGIIVVNEINKTKESKVNNATTAAISDKKIKEVEKQIVVYTEESYLKSVSSKVEYLYHEVRDRIMELDGVKMEPKKFYVAFKLKTNFCDLTLNRNSLRVFINMKKGTLKDPEGLTEDISDRGHWGNGDYQVIMKDDENIDALYNLIKQSYKVNQ